MIEDPAILAMTAACHRLAALGYGTSTSGNLSARLETDASLVALTPSGVGLGEVHPEDMAVMALDGRVLNEGRPTKEWEGHLEIHRKLADVCAVVHVHPCHAIACGMHLSPGRHIPSITPQFVMRCGRVPVISYHPPGSRALAEAIAAAAPGCRAILLQNHGVHTFAASFSKAIGILEELEENCRQWLLAGRDGHLLDENQIAGLLSRQM